MGSGWHGQPQVWPAVNTFVLLCPPPSHPTLSLQNSTWVVFKIQFGPPAPGVPRPPTPTPLWQMRNDRVPLGAGVGQLPTPLLPCGGGTLSWGPGLKPQTASSSKLQCVRVHPKCHSPGFCSTGSGQRRPLAPHLARGPEALRPCPGLWPLGFPAGDTSGLQALTAGGERPVGLGRGSLG